MVAQLENGFTQIANEILEGLATTKLNGTQLRILLVVFRYTYGFKRKQHKLSESFIAKATGIHKQQIKRELSQLIQDGIILVKQEATFTTPRVLEFNKRYQVSKKIPPIELDTTTGSENDTTTGSELDTQERKNLKKEVKENIYRKIQHLKLTKSEFDKLSEEYSKTDIDSVLDDMENYAKLKNYKSANLTARKWLEKRNAKKINQHKKTEQPWMEDFIPGGD